MSNVDKLYLIEERNRLIMDLSARNFSAADIGRIFKIHRSRVITIIKNHSVKNPVAK